MADRLVDVLRLLAKRAGGFRTSDPLLESFGPPGTIGRNMGHLVKAGEIVGVRLSAKSALYFGNPADAAAWMFKNNHQTWAPAGSLRRSAELKTCADTRPSGEVVQAPECKVTVCPGYEPRYQAVEVPGAPRVYHGSMGRLR
jgi:hypothetical protein